MDLITSFTAVGDSFTEGLNDDARFDGRHRGWADRVADQLLARQPIEQLVYANLAVRGRLMSEVCTEQVPIAVGMQPDLVSFAAGVNDALRRNFDIDAVATDLEHSVRSLRTGGSTVLLFAYGDPTRRSPALGRVSDRMWALRSATLAIAEAHECLVVDFWGVAAYDDERLWSQDRLHLSALGHRVTAAAVLERLGLGDDRWRSPVAEPRRESWTQRRADDARWIAGHAAPWFTRRIKNVSSGVGVEPKDPIARVLHKH